MIWDGKERKSYKVSVRKTPFKESEKFYGTYFQKVLNCLWYNMKFAILFSFSLNFVYRVRLHIDNKRGFNRNFVLYKVHMLSTANLFTVWASDFEVRPNFWISIVTVAAAVLLQTLYDSVRPRAGLRHFGRRRSQYDCSLWLRNVRFWSQQSHAVVPVVWGREP